MAADGGSPRTGLVGLNEICRILAGQGRPPLTAMRISQLHKEGMPKAERGQYDPIRCMFWYIGRLRGNVERKELDAGDGTATSLTGDRKRLLILQAEREELELAKARGESMSVQDHEKVVADLVMEVKAHVLAVSPRLAADVVGETSRVMVQAKADKHLRGVLERLAKSVPSLHKLAQDPPEPAPPAPRVRKAKGKATAKPKKKKKAVKTGGG